MRQRIADGLALMGIQTSTLTATRISCPEASSSALPGASTRHGAKIILFDEPLSNLDARLRLRMRSENPVSNGVWDLPRSS